MVLNYILVGCPWLRSRINVFKQSVFFIGWSCGQIGRYRWHCGQLQLCHLHQHFPLKDLRCACFPSEKAALNLSELLGLALYVDTILNTLKSYFWCCWQVERKRCRGKHATLLDSVGKGRFFLLAQKLNIKHCEEWEHSNILPPSKTFLFLITLIFYHILSFKCDFASYF